MAVQKEKVKWFLVYVVLQDMRYGDCGGDTTGITGDNVYVSEK
jgi:hypothetical protein